MLEERGDLWQLPADARCITTNGYVKSDGSAVMGRGCAQQARDRFPGVDAYLGMLLEERGNHVHALMVAPHRALPVEPIPGTWDLVAFPVKHNWYETADIDLIGRSCGELMALADQNPSWHRILLPRPGCGNGQLSWERVRPRITDLLDDRVIVIDR
jgi:hypothetical protein